MKAALLLSVIFLAACATAPQNELERLGGFEPAPDLSPLDVVQIQIDAFAANDGDDRGIDIAFRFASPANRSVTGPADRFGEMMRGPGYAAMLNPVRVTYGNVRIAGNTAQVPVRITTVDGRDIIYLFVLERQTDEPYVECWMTDGVQVLGTIQEPAPQTI